MTDRYKTGTRAEVLQYMAECAIRDRMAMIEATKGAAAVDPRSAEYVDECMAVIRDFRRLAGLGKESSDAAK